MSNKTINELYQWDGKVEKILPTKKWSSETAGICETPEIGMK